MILWGFGRGKQVDGYRQKSRRNRFEKGPIQEDLVQHMFWRRTRLTGGSHASALTSRARSPARLTGGGGRFYAPRGARGCWLRHGWWRAGARLLRGWAG